MKALYASLYFSFSLIIINSQYQGPPSFWGKQEKMTFTSGKQRPNFEGSRGTILGSRQISNFLGNKPNYFRGARERGGPQYHIE